MNFLPSKNKKTDKNKEKSFKKFKKMNEELKDIAEIEQRPKMDGRQMVMYLAPIRSR